MPKTYEPISTTTLGTTSTSVTFSTISGAYTDLILQVNNQMSSASGFKLRFNSDSGSNYSQTHLIGHSTTTVVSSRTTSASSITNNLVFGDSTTADVFTPNIIQIQNYSNSTTNKTLLWRYGSTTPSEVGAIVGLWEDTSAITAIEITPWNVVNFQTGCTFTLYGIKAA
jgi:hypothetical protein